MIWTIILALLLAGESETSVQSPAEEHIGAEFEAAVPGLFDEWLAARPAIIESLALGKLGTAPKRIEKCHRPDKKYSTFFVFIECADISEPVVEGFDVRRTDSLITPFLGIIKVKVEMACSLKRLLPSDQAWASDGAAERIKQGCIGKRYQECVNAGTAAPKKSAWKFDWVCTGGSYEEEPVVREMGSTATLSYAWKRGRWEFQREEADPPLSSLQEF